MINAMDFIVLLGHIKKANPSLETPLRLMNPLIQLGNGVEDILMCRDDELSPPPLDTTPDDARLPKQTFLQIVDDIIDAKVDSVDELRRGIIHERALGFYAELMRDDRVVTPGMGISAWLQSDDVGLSSKFMVTSQYESVATSEYAIPRDADDFGRCQRALVAIPELRKRLPQIASLSEQWAVIVRRWDELEHLMKERDCAEVYRILCRIGDMA